MSSTTTEVTTTKTCDMFQDDNKVMKFLGLFFLIWVVVWMILFSFNPYFVQKQVDGTTETVEKIPDPLSVFWSSLVLAIVIIIIIAIIYALL